MLFKMIGEIKCLATGLDALLSSFSTSRRCSRNRSTSRLPVSPMHKSASSKVDDIGRGTSEMISNRNWSIGCQYFNVASSMLWFNVQIVGTGLIFLKLILFFEFGLKLVLIISIYSIKYRQFIMNECIT